ncbi:hypothetical protein KSP39_PZI003441 [Platanthera zijinensis]|uniref:Uncharacterized protein n=1 Tax=Platanthera zijinensis TaxID=2320716 RepID=A0AAP0BX09_9ASPA
MEIDIPMTRSPVFVLSSAPSSPYASTPSSPTRFDSPFSYHCHSTSQIDAELTPWEYQTPNDLLDEDDDEDGEVLFDFSFTAGRHHVPGSFEIATADKLFEKGRIRTLQDWGRTSSANSSRSGRRETRSLSPRRDDGLLAKDITSPDNPVKGRAGRKWPRLKDFLLFRSASEGRVTGRGSKDPLRKFTRQSSPVSFSDKKKSGGDKKAGGEELVRRGCGPAASPHEMHYTANRAAAVERMKKAPLPFRRQGLLGFNPFNPAIQGRSRAVGCSSFSRTRY